MALQVNEIGVKHAKKLIEERKINVNSSWNREAQPTAEDEDLFIAQHGWKEYGKWFLAVNPDTGKDEKKNYEFPFGDFKKVYREALIAAKRRAAQYKHPQIEKAADDLLQLIEKKETVRK